MRTTLLSQDYSCRKLAAASSCRVSRPARAEDLIKGGGNSPPAAPHPADACNAHPADACDATSRSCLLRRCPQRAASDNPTASSSPQCVTCRLL
ncbi:hypothetical protein K503DRAFT_775905 [Rhizopogon vinicolor AM-OR11-026]|uniref:Uncharacterized protein n=1 Tax=Rhizopogon vinicolor AM-OR11-026 TaxID=1314800 RepID=A0A1B7MKQ6_9AGAM|nr:hypothetical protein K503DRAFT_775905 [Rhizopogon vinicolor AM-OR11-026]